MSSHLLLDLTKCVFHLKTVLPLRVLVAGFSPRGPGFNSKPVYVGFVVDKISVRFDSNTSVVPMSTSPSMFQIPFTQHQGYKTLANEDSS
jgi:hypothetical protein